MKILTSSELTLKLHQADIESKRRIEELRDTVLNKGLSNLIQENDKHFFHLCQLVSEETFMNRNDFLSYLTNLDKVFKDTLKLQRDSSIKNKATIYGRNFDLVEKELATIKEVLKNYGIQ